MFAEPSSLLDWLRLTKSGASDTLYSCLTVILASTFLALHLNVPPTPPEARASAFYIKKWWAVPTMREFRRQLLRAAIVVVAPELLVSLAFGDWRAAVLGHYEFQHLGESEESFSSNITKWTRTHASFANMGGLRFVMEKGEKNIPETAHLRNNNRRQLVDTLLEKVRAHTTWQDIIAGLIEICVKLRRLWQRSKAPINETTNIEVAHLRGSLEVQVETDSSPNPSGPSNEESSIPRLQSIDLSDTILAATYRGDDVGGEEENEVPLPESNTIAIYLNATQIVMAQLLGILDEGPRLSKEEIEDKGKTSVLVKGLAILQLLWFTARAIIRHHQGTLSQLELASCTYVMCTLLAYALYWSKPQGVQRPVEHRVHITDTVRAVTDEDLLRYLRPLGGSSFLVRNFLPPFGTDSESHHPTHPIPTDISLTTFCKLGPEKGQVLLLDSDFAGIIAGIILGFIHCLAWHHEFATLWERWAWRLAAVVITGSLVPYSIANGICTVKFQQPQENRFRRTHIVHVLLLYAILSSYIGCRVLVLIEMGRTFFS
jgi:hypothetical protein